MQPEITVSGKDFIRALDSEEKLPDIKKIAADSGVFSDCEVKDLVANIRRYIRFPDGDELRTYAYLSGGDIAGFLSFGLGLGKKTYEIYWVCVSPKFQGRGVASELLRFAEGYIREKGGRRIFIETSSRQEYSPARQFYKKRGYESSAVVKDYFDEGDDKVVYSKKMQI
ncbi:MAG: hypothetical protein MSIBF_05115 [Candidatus Altiarchaeales archaeon IMC4]|nr:MAG: hypothetical protein MSIBF_05115 [Candidatus Altiarchaeales archaeon IMC4]